MTMRETLDEIDEDEMRQLRAGGSPAAYEDSAPPEMPLPDDDLPEAESRDFSESPEALSLLETQAPSGVVRPTETREQRKAAEYEEETGEPAPAGRPAPQDEYTAALRRIKETLAKPTPDYSKGLATAQAKDARQNRMARIMDYMSAGLRRAPTPNLSPAATNASGFLQAARLGQQSDAGELSRLGKVAQLAKPPPQPKPTSRDAGNVEGLRSYLVKVGVASPEELAGMSEKQLNAVKDAYGLKYRMDHDAEQFAETKRHNKQAEGAAWAAAHNRPVPASEGGAIGEVGAATTALDELYAAHKAGGFGGLTSRVGAVATEKLGLNNQTAQYQDQMKATAQVVGRILEEGKMTDADLPRYLAMMPQPGDDDVRASKKVQFINHLLQLKRDGKVDALAALGFNVKGVQGKGGKMVNVRFPNGNTVPVPEAEVNEAVTKFGGEVAGD